MLHRKPMTRTRLVRKYEALRLLLSVSLGLVLCLIMLLLYKDVGVKAMFYFLFGPVYRANRFVEILYKMQPMLLTGCSFILMVSVGNFSLINTTCVSLAPALICSPILLNEALFGSIPGEFGKIVWISCGCIASALIASVISLIPPLIKRRFGCDEVITSSLINSISAFFVDWFVKHVLYDFEAGVSASRPYPDGVKPTRLVQASYLSTMFIVGLIFCVFTYIFLYYTRLGYAGRIVGSSPSFARASGIDVRLVMISVSAISGAIAGVAGTLNTLTFNQRFGGFTADISDGMFCGIFSKDNALLLPISAFGLSYLRVAAETMSNNTDVPLELVNIMTSFIIMMLAAEQLLSHSRDKAVKKYFPVTGADRETSGPVVLFEEQ